MPRPPRSGGLAEALGTDTDLYVKFAQRFYAEGKIPLGLNWLAWNLDEVPIGEAKVAVTMRYAEKQGLVVRDRAPAPNPPFVIDGQTAWTPTEKLLALVPEDGPTVMPDEVLTTSTGARVSSVPGKDARRWGPESGDVPLGPAGVARTLGRGKGPGLIKPREPFKGYLPPPADVDADE
jgi:hypothetical protein